jgi:hypothetical protein
MMKADVKILKKAVTAYTHRSRCPDIQPVPDAVGGEEGRSRTERWLRELC